MKRWIFFIPVFMLITSILTMFIYSQEAITIKIGTVIPERSPWDKALKRISREWARITDGNVRLKIYAGGIAGSEIETVENMHSGILGGAALTMDGISHIYSDFSLFYTPLLFTGDKEFNEVFEKMKPLFEKKIEEKGFKVIIWSWYGWVRFFSKNPVFYPEDLSEHKLSITAENPGVVQAAKYAGFDPVPIKSNDLMMNLQSGRVTAFYHLPIIAAAGQYYSQVPNMCALKVGPGIGGFFILKSTWEKIPDHYKSKLILTAQEVNKDLLKEIIEIEEEAIETMKEYDLMVNKLPADAQKKWEDTLDKFVTGLKGKVYSESVYNRVCLYLKEYRERKGKKE